MSSSSATFLTWAPRVLCLGFAAFISLFALDAFEPGRSLWANLGAFAVHLTPTFILLGMFAIGWRWPKVAGALLILGGCAYALMSPARQHLSWIAVIAAPAWITGALFFMTPASRPKVSS